MISCGKDKAGIVSNLNPNPESSGIVTFADEIAADVSENVIPQEATVFTSVSFNIPGDMVPAEGNTDTKAFYLSPSSNDLSFVAYQRRDNSGKITYKTMSEEDFRVAFKDNLGVEPNVRSFDKEIKDGYFKISIYLGYEVAGIGYSCREYVFVTDEYIFSVAYCQDSRTEWLEEFANSTDSISLVSVVGSKIDRLVPGELVIEEVEETEEVEVVEETKGTDDADEDKTSAEDVETESDNSIESVSEN